MNKIQANTLTAGFEWIDGIPEGWQRRIIKRDFEVVLGKMLQSNQTNEAETEESYLRSANIKWEGVDTSDIKTMWFSTEEKERLRLKYGDLLVSEGGDAGRTSIWRNELETCYIQNAINRIRAQQDDSTSYLFYWLYLLKSIGCIDAVVSRITIAHLTAEKLDRIVFLKPPKIEQDRIAAYLDKTCAAIDTAIEKKQKQLVTLNALRKSIIYSVFTEKNDCPFERVKDVIVKIGSGVTPEGGASSYLDDGVPLLRSQNVHFDGLRLDDVAYISAETHAEMRSSQLQPRDVLLNITGASIGRCTFVPEGFGEGNVNQHVCIVRPGPHVDYRFLAAFLSSPLGQDQILSTFTGASRQGLSHKDLGLIRIPIPLVKAQREAVDRIEEHDATHRNLYGCIAAQIDILTAYRKSLIHECVTGKRRITEEYMRVVQQY